MIVDGASRMPDGASRAGGTGRTPATAWALLMISSLLSAACGDGPAHGAAADGGVPDRSPDAGYTSRADPDSLATTPRAGNGMGTSSGEVAGERPTVLFIGTSLTAGAGIDLSEAYPTVVGRMLDSAGRPARIVNAGVSGETSAGALRRIEWVLRTPADIIVVETGANDGLRGLSVASLQENVEAILDRVRALQPHARVILVQMEAPPNMGPRYTKAFHDLFPAAAKKKGVELMPFLLEGVAGDPTLNQDDGIHPNASGARIVAANVTRALLGRYTR